jgi:hypothetical protein
LGLTVSSLICGDAATNYGCGKRRIFPRRRILLFPVGALEVIYTYWPDYNVCHITIWIRVNPNPDG